MGKIIVKNIKGMGWKAKISLIAMFTLMFSILMYQGWQQLRNAQAAVAVETQWSIRGTGTVATFPAMSLAKSAGTNRLLVVKVVGDYGTARTTFLPTVTYGGQTLTRITSTDTTSRQKVWFGYLNEAGIVAATGATPAFNVTWNAAPTAGCGLSAAFYSNVDQGAPITGSRAVSSDGTTATTPTSGAIAVTNGGWAIYGSNLNQATASTPATGYTEHFDTANGTLYEDAVGSKTITVTGTEDPRPTWAAIRYAFASVALNPAITTLATGADPAAVTIAPGAAASDANAFTLQTGSAGTTEAITSITVNLSSNVGIARLAITNNANTELGFTTAPITGSNTITVTGLTATNTATTYKVRVTSLSHALMPVVPGAANAVTVPVTAWAGSNMHAGTDTDTAALTIDNLSPTNPTGFSGTPAANQVTLNWTNPGADFSQVIVLRNTSAITDIPVEGATYTSASTIGTSAVRYVGAAATFLDSTALNGTAYYYKIFAKDAYGNYSQTGAATGPITPVSPDSVAPTVDAGFAATTPLNVLTVPITSFGATDNGGGSGVDGYMITTSSAQPAAGAAGWTAAPPTTYTAGAAGTFTLYPWAKDAGGNVSSVYAAPVTVVIDQTKPTVTAFTVTAQVISRNIPLGSFTASDTGGSNLSGYMVTTSGTAPAFDAAGWLASAPATFTVLADGSYTLYPWARDGAGNVSLAFGTPRTVLVDSTAPTGLALVAPIDEVTGLPQATTISSTTATDSGSGGVMYQFQITDEAAYTQNSGWIAGTSFAPTGLAQGVRYLWTAKAKDALGNETAWLPQRSFTTTAPCVRNDPTLTLLNATGGVASTIATEGGMAAYNLRVYNNDTGDCGATTFNLSLQDTDTYFAFEDSSFDTGLTKSITLQPNTNTVTTVTALASLEHDSGVEKTVVTSAADAYHASITTGFVQTTLNVVTCQPKLPLLIVGPDSGYLNKGGKMVYTITVKNTDTGAACAPVNYTLSIPGETNSTDFDASQLSTTSLILNAGELRSATLTVSAKSTAAKNAVNISSIGIVAAGHASPPAISVRSTVNNPMLHNSDNTGSPKWSVSGGWGIPNGRYGEIGCNTCHVGGGGDTANIKRVNEKVFTPYTTVGGQPRFPGEGVPIAYRRYVGDSAAKPVLGWDFGATPRPNPTSTRICEACHTYDSAGTNGVKAHPFKTTATLGNHFNTDGTDCTRCHKHNKGFGASNMVCNSCHGDANVADITADNRYVVAPPANAAGVTGTLTGVGQVSNDKKVGAHQTHLQFSNGFSNYSTVDFRCVSCHGPVPTGFAHADGNSSPNGKFQGLAIKGGMSPTFNGTNLTCSNTYCHNPSASGILKNAVNTGSKVFPSWTGAKYLGDARKTQANCGVCHKSPGDVGFQPAGTHSGMTISGTTCIGCHGHEGDSQGAAGKRHMDGLLYGAGACNTCHGYLAASWTTAPVINAGGAGAHAAHITYLTTKRFTITLNPDTGMYADTGAAWTNVCGVCHDNLAGKHLDNIVDVKLKSDYFFGTTGVSPLYNGTPGGAGSKTCSNLNCHYFTTPLWSN